MMSLLAADTLEDVCSVAEMARRLGLSRSRFNDLIRKQVFPPPALLLANKRPCYPLQLQELCKRIRRTGIDLHGRPVIFYARRTAARSRRPSVETEVVRPLMRGLRKMGLKPKTEQLRAAVKALYPKGLDRIDSSVVVSLFRYLSDSQAPET